MKTKSSILRIAAITAIAAVLFLAPARAGEADAIDSKPVPVKTPPPKYPTAMSSEGIQGLVTVKVVIDEKGDVAECAINKSTRSEFEKPALEAIRTWKFRPASKGGVAVRSQVIIPVKFSREA
jgi:periplasmic protein TonB